MISAAELHAQSIVIDGTCPLLYEPSHLDTYRAGGLTAVVPTVDDREGGARGTLGKLGDWIRRIREDDSLLLVRKSTDIQLAKSTGRLGIILHFQGGDPIENQLDFIDAYKAIGVGMIQICNNVKNRIGDGCEERTDAGLSRFGLSVIKRLNDARIVVDCSHTGLRTTLDAIEASKRPVVFSHAGACSVHPSPRNIIDSQIKAVAATGGLVGAVAYPPFVSASRPPTMAEFIAHIRYMVDLVGVDHVGLGLDYWTHQSPYVTDEVALANYEDWIASGRWTAASYPPPPYIYPQGMETPDKMANVTEGLRGHGFSDEETQKIIGGNWVRVFKEVWGE